MEERGLDAKIAKGKLTCFGGKREMNESPVECIQRECKEELAWSPSNLKHALNFYVDGKLVAYFYEAEAPPKDFPLKYEIVSYGAVIFIALFRIHFIIYLLCAYIRIINFREEEEYMWIHVTKIYHLGTRVCSRHGN